MKYFPLLAAIVVLFSGCLSVNEKLLPKTTVINPPKQAGTLEVKKGPFIQKLNDEGDHRGVVSNTTLLNSVSDNIFNRWKSKNIVSSFGTAGRLTGPPDYTVTISGYRNEDASIFGAVICGLSLYIIPTTCTLTFDLDFEFVNNRTKKKYAVKAKNAVTTYQQLFLLPCLPFSFNGNTEMFNDIADYTYEDLRKQGAFN